MQHRTSSLEDLVACSKGVVADIVPWELGEEGDEGLVGALWRALGVVRLQEVSILAHRVIIKIMVVSYTVRLLSMPD